MQASAHGRLSAAVLDEGGVRLVRPQRRVAPGQAVVIYDAATGAEVLGGGIAAGRQRYAPDGRYGAIGPTSPFTKTAHPAWRASPAESTTGTTHCC